MGHKSEILEFLRQNAPKKFSNTDIEALTGIKPHAQVFQITASLRDKKLIQGQQYGKRWVFWIQKSDGKEETSSCPQPIKAHQVAHKNDLHEQIQAYYGRIIAGEQHRYRSWERCNSYFSRVAPEGFTTDRNQAALQLAFYLASWGMYRGKSFLLQYDYTVHLSMIDMLCDPHFASLWKTEFGSHHADKKLVSTILDLIEGIRKTYRPFAAATDSGGPTDTLVTKIILGTFACLPACDRYFRAGFKSAGFSYSYLNRNFIEHLLGFCQNNLSQLREEQMRIKAIGGMYYPLMKLVDMYFFQVGFTKDETADEMES